LCREERADGDAARRHPVMRAVDADAIAVRGGPVSEDDAAESHAQRCRKMTRLAAVVVDERPQKRLPECNACVTAPIVPMNIGFARIKTTLVRARREGAGKRAQ